MTRFERVLSDDFFDDLGARTAYDNWVGFGRKVEQTVLAKLAEQEPVAWFIDDKRACGNRIITDLAIAKDWLEDNPDKVTPLYALPCVASVCDKTTCGAENAESDAQETIAWIFEDDLPNNYPYEAMFKYSKVDWVRMFPVYAPTPTPCVSPTSDETACVSEIAESETQHYLEYIKRYQKWRRGEDKTMTEAGLEPKQIGEALDWLIVVVEDHIADMRKIAPEGWQLIPKDPTMDMIKALLETIVTTSKGGVVNPKTTLTYALAAAPKYTGEK